MHGRHMDVKFTKECKQQHTTLILVALCTVSNLQIFNKQKQRAIV
jgi:hypothetical protein